MTCCLTTVLKLKIFERELSEKICMRDKMARKIKFERTRIDIEHVLCTKKTTKKSKFS